jgi:hypothetical protein
LNTKIKMAPGITSSEPQKSDIMDCINRHFKKVSLFFF